MHTLTRVWFRGFPFNPFLNSQPQGDSKENPTMVETVTGTATEKDSGEGAANGSGATVATTGDPTTGPGKPAAAIIVIGRYWFPLQMNLIIGQLGNTTNPPITAMC